MTNLERSRLGEINELVNAARTSVAQAADAARLLERQSRYDLSLLRADLGKSQNELAGVSDDIDSLLAVS